MSSPPFQSWICLRPDSHGLLTIPIGNLPLESGMSFFNPKPPNHYKASYILLFLMTQTEANPISMCRKTHYMPSSSFLIEKKNLSYGDSMHFLYFHRQIPLCRTSYAFESLSNAGCNGILYIHSPDSMVCVILESQNIFSGIGPFPTIHELNPWMCGTRNSLLSISGISIWIPIFHDGNSIDNSQSHS